METKPVALHVEEEEEDDELVEPVSPTGQYFNSSVLSVSIIAALESEIPIDDSVAITMLNNVFLPISPRFSSVMVRADDGGKEWKKVDVRLEEHVKVPVFPNELSPESYDELFQGYLTKIGMEQLPQNRPLWDIHIFKYPTSNAAGTLVFRLHHALGDGYSLMGALFTCLQRADNPSLPLTFPCSQLEPKKPGQTLKSVVGLLSVMLNTAKDFSSSLLKSSVLKDHVTPIRSAAEGKEFHPVAISTVTFSIEQIKQIRAKLGGTINDVIVGVIFYGTRLYMDTLSKGSGNARSTALVLLNTRVIHSYNYKTVKEMVKKDTDGPWGNHFGFLHVAIPKANDTNTEDPLEFVTSAKNIIQKKKNSLGVLLTGRLLELMRRYRGPEKTAEYIHSTLSNASMAITNLLGPVEKMSLANHPIKGLYFMVVNAPMNLTVTIVSYMGKLRLAVGADKELINHKIFCTSLETAFERISKAASSTS